jgi:hypothetical protein
MWIDRLPPPPGHRTRAAATLLIVALLAGGCGRLTAGGPAGEAGGDSPARYRQGLATTAKPLSSALAGMAGAMTLPALTGRLAQAEQAASATAEQLDQLEPPREARAGHADLVRAVWQLNSDLGALADAVGAHELCASSAVMARLGASRGLAALRDAGGALAAVAGGAQGYRLDLQVPPTPKEQRRRLGNGQLVRPGSRTGQGELTVQNHSGQDAVLTLALGRRPVLSVYVRSGAGAKVAGVRDGVYQVWYTKGVDWDPRARAFTRDCAFERFDGTFAFKTTATQSTAWTVGLEPASGGNANATEVDPKDFPAA